MYIAVTYIGGKYIPGEAISEDMPKEKLDWLIRAGAVRKAASAPSMPVFEPEATEEAEAPQEEPEAIVDEIDEEDEAPEIDVMAGIVKGDEAAPAKKPKPAAKKSPKGGKAQ